MIDYSSFKTGVQNLLQREISNEEMTELCGEPLLQLLKEVVESEATDASNHNQTK